MVSSEVQRTLVKSPPELWAELSDPAALARHLGELGEIRIVETKPEERVAWEADGATGTVLIKASGWGTKVTLSAIRTRDELAPADEGEHAAEAQKPEDDIEPPATVGTSAPDSTLSPEPAPELAHEPTPGPRRGFFARLFRRRRAERSAEAVPEHVALVEPKPTPPADASTPELLSGPTPATAPIPPLGDAPSPADISAELGAAEDFAGDEIAAVLTSVLDRLGAAHHRPFSRA
jgi:hypothetical protein